MKINDIKNKFIIVFPNNNIEFRKSVDDEIFILNTKWKTFKDVQNDVKKVKQIKELNDFDISICIYDLRINSVDFYDTDEGILGDYLGELLHNSYCREFEPDYDRELLDKYQKEYDPEYTDEKLDEYLNSRDFNYEVMDHSIDGQKQNYRVMLRKYNNLKEDELLYVHNDPCLIYPDYSYSSIAKVNDLMIVDIDEPEKYGFYLKVGILLKKKEK